MTSVSGIILYVSKLIQYYSVKHRNEARNARAKSTPVISARKTSHKHNNKNLCRCTSGEAYVPGIYLHAI